MLTMKLKIQNSKICEEVLCTVAGCVIYELIKSKFLHKLWKQKFPLISQLNVSNWEFQKSVKMFCVSHLVL